MMNYQKFCENYNCDYDKYYLIQAGGSNDKDEISFYTGKPFQRGYNIFSTFGRKYALPFLKYFGHKAFNYGKNVVTDILKGDEPKKVLRSNLKRAANETIDDAKKYLNQEGKRRKIKAKSSNKKKGKPNKNQSKKSQPKKKKPKKKKSKKKKSKKYKPKSRNSKKKSKKLKGSTKSKLLNKSKFKFKNIFDKLNGKRSLKGRT